MVSLSCPGWPWTYSVSQVSCDFLTLLLLPLRVLSRLVSSRLLSSPLLLFLLPFAVSVLTEAKVLSQQATHSRIFFASLTSCHLAHSCSFVSVTNFHQCLLVQMPSSGHGPPEWDRAPLLADVLLSHVACGISLQHKQGGATGALATE